MRPFSIRLFAPLGDPEGVLVASRDDWPGRAVLFPRRLTGEVRGRREYAQPGVYVLTSHNTAYIGEGDPVGDRIDAHAKLKDFWDRGVLFTAEAGRLNKAFIQHLESRMIGLARESGRYALDNRNQPVAPTLSEEDHAAAENFLHHILVMMPLLGFPVFSVPAGDTGDGTTEVESAGEVAEGRRDALGKRAARYAGLPRGLEFSLDYAGAHALLVLVDNGVMVKQGSTVVHPPRERFEVDAPGYAALRRQLIESAVIADMDGAMTFTSDQFFASGSAAATVVRAKTSNADWWQGNDGRSLGDLLRASCRVAMERNS